MIALTDNDVHGRLLAATQRLAVDNGLEDVSLRAVSAAVGKSTTVVFQHFGSKEGLLLASIGDAFVQDQGYHARLREALEGLEIDAGTLAGILCHYVTDRVARTPARLWLEACYKSREFPMLASILADWEAMRRAFWRDLLRDTPLTALALLIPAFTTAEEAYASVLAGDIGYDLLLRESAWRLAIGGCADASRGAAGRWRESRVRQFAAVDREAVGSTMARLLDQAVRVLAKRGAAGLNLRRVAADAEVAPSQIVYYFKDFATFRRQAIVEALRQGMPAFLDPTGQASAAAEAPGDWAQTLTKMTLAGRPGRPAGFYVNYARILGQACLTAVRDSTLRPLILDLRAIEGAGIHRLSGIAWPDACKLGREGATVFALWIKGHAITGEALAGIEPRDSDGEELAAAAALVADAR